MTRRFYDDFDFEPRGRLRAERIERKRIKPAIRIALAEAQNWRCCYCTRRCHLTHQPLVTIEYLVAKKHKGGDEWENLVMACFDCNVHRQCSYTAEEFYMLGWIKQMRENERRKYAWRTI